MSNSGLANFIDRIEALRREARENKRQEREVYQEAEEAGHNKRAIKLIVRERERDPEDVANDFVAHSRMVKMLGDLKGTELGDWAVRHEAALIAARKRGNTKATKEGTTLAA